MAGSACFTEDKAEGQARLGGVFSFGQRGAMVGIPDGAAGEQIPCNAGPVCSVKIYGYD